MIDTHTHLNDVRLLPRVKDIAEDGGLTAMLVVGFDLKSSRAGVELAKRYGKIYAAVGCHPHDAKDYNEEHEKFFIEAAKNKKVVALGEIGLDYHYDLSPRDVQAEVFIKQLRLAHELRLPVIVHIREADGEAFDILTRHKDLINDGIVLHCYSGSKEMVERYKSIDPYFSFAGPVTYKRANRDEVIRAVPEDRLLIETDCPYLSPEPVRGTVNEPKNVLYVAEYIAKVRGTGTETIIKTTTENARRLFNI